MSEFVAGLVGGTAGLVVGHPLDTVKALIQARGHKSMTNSIKILLNEKKMSKGNGLGFFRGLALPFMAYGPLNSLLFGLYGMTLKIIDKSNEPSLKNIFIAGTIAGTISTVPTNPLELVKIQLQTHNHKEISGVWDCLCKIQQTSGFRGFFRGLPVLIARDSFSYGLYFASFELMRREGRKHQLNSQIFIDLVCGGVAGSLTWLSVLPLDVLKTGVQADREVNMTLAQRAKILWQNEGWSGFFKGTRPLVLRAFLVNSVTFCCYVQTLEFLENFKWKNNEMI